MTGPFIVARSIFSSEHEDNVTNTEWICLARSMFGVAVAAIFLVCDLPETPESDIEDIEAEAEACLAGPRKREGVLSFKPPAEPSHHRSSTPSSLGDPHTDQDISSDTVHDDSSSAFDSRTEYALSDDGIAEGSSDTDCYIEKSPPSPSSSSSSKFYAPKAGRYPASESAGSTCLHHDPLRMRGGAADGDAGEDGDANDGHGNDHEQNQTQDELIRAISAQQAEMQKALDRLLNDRKRKERDDDETEQLAAARAKLEREFEAIEDKDLAAVEAKIPYKIRQVFAGGWKKHVPFTMLTNAYCQSDEAFEEAGDQIVMGPSGAIKTAPTSLKAPARAEDSLLLPEWLQACQRFLILVEKYRSAKEYLAWKAHIDIIMSDDRRDEMWATWMQYDIKLRKRATRRVINAGKFHEDVFNRIERKDLANERAGRTAAFAQSVQSVLDQAQQAGPSGAGQYSFRANAKPTRANSNKSQPGASHNQFKRTHAKFCFRCGNDNHNHKYCNASTRINGKPLVVEGVFPWEILLRQLDLLDEFGDVPIGLRNGFRIGAPRLSSPTYIPNNHKTATDRPHIIEEHILSELSAGRYAGPFSQDVIENALGPFRCAPLGLVDKASSPGKFRVIQDFSAKTVEFSFPRDDTPPSLNAQINTNNFPCEWDMFPDIAKAVALAPPGSVAATCDVDAAYRQMPVHPEDRHQTVVHWKGCFFIDKCVPFGAASSNGIFGRCGDAAKHIYSKLGFGQIFKWVDDYIFLQSPETTRDLSAPRPPFADLNAIYAVADQLGWPWKKAKTRPFATTFAYLGFEWDLRNRRVSIPTAKRQKYTSRILFLLMERPTPHLALSEADWWTNTLSNPECGHDLPVPSEPIPLQIMSDASTSFGVGVIIGGHWWAWRMSSGWKKPGKDIGWAEALALELAVSGVIASGVHDCTIRCLCDNQGVVHAWAAGRSRNAFQNLVLMRTMTKAWEAQLTVQVVYVRSKDNLADAPSRGMPPKAPLQPGLLHIPIPKELVNILIPATLYK
ncbi:Reverse transcriptase domain protein [Ceratobasidium sp. AG-Ba]|nr:Reverse transcriptase domain protein [Ceratobasidium sp. AG-Ba]